MEAPGPWGQGAAPVTEAGLPATVAASARIQDPVYKGSCEMEGPPPFTRMEMLPGAGSKTCSLARAAKAGHTLPKGGFGTHFGSILAPFSDPFGTALEK